MYKMFVVSRIKKNKKNKKNNYFLFIKMSEEKVRSYICENIKNGMATVSLYQKSKL